jgi:hypothetical protein
MMELRRIVTFLGARVRDWSLWMACLVALTVGPWTRLAGEAMGPWLAVEGVAQVHSIGWLIGLYMGVNCAFRGTFVVARSRSWGQVRFRFVVIGLHVGVLGAAAWVGAGGGAGTGWSPLALAWGTLMITALATCLTPHLRGPGRSSLATVAVAWWIPAVLPPSFLVVVPRALRSLLTVGPEIAVPSEPAAWMADTALVAGLLLLAWAPRRATPRGDEVRHPG